MIKKIILITLFPLLAFSQQTKYQTIIIKYSESFPEMTNQVSILEKERERFVFFKHHLQEKAEKNLESSTIKIAEAKEKIKARRNTAIINVSYLGLTVLPKQSEGQVISKITLRFQMELEIGNKKTDMGTISSVKEAEWPFGDDVSQLYDELTSLAISNISYFLN